MQIRKGAFLISSLIMIGLVIALWWMHSAEEQVTASHSSRKTEKLSYSKLTPQIETRAPATSEKKEPVAVDTLKPKMIELDQILESKNDNDPRLDSDFKTLNEAEKNALKEKYTAYAQEKLNERGTLVFLIGRNINSKEDLSFMNQVLVETPCGSLGDCSVTAPRATGEAAHEESANSVTLAYPQIVSIKSLENFLFQTSTDPTLRALAVNSLTQATHSRTTVVADLARQALKKLAP